MAMDKPLLSNGWLERPFEPHFSAPSPSGANSGGQDTSDIKPLAAFSSGRQGKTLLLSSRPSRNGERPLQIIVRDNNIDQALKALKKKMQREGIFREMKLRGHYEKPSEKRARERAEAIRRYRKLQRKRMQREGLLPK
jgi:small subunit ribosomal protein S21